MAQAAFGVAPLRLSSRPWIFSSLLSKNPHQLFIPNSSFSTSFRRNALRPPNTLLPEDDANENSNDDGSSRQRKRRNEMKREARRAVKWAVELAKFNNVQIKRVLRGRARQLFDTLPLVASLDEEVYDALMLVKRLGPDIREGKRRQFNYIGRLLREAQPELIEALIQASRDGDNSRLHALSGGESISVEDDEEEEDTTYEEEEEEDDKVRQGSENHIEVAARWLDGLIYKDQSITNEVYSVHNVEFDRQELRKLVRRVQSVQQGLLDEESGQKNDSKLTKVRKPLIRFLRSLAKKSLAE